mmetsp:Transcript_56685/g.121674  ORF Transcript_56685/g.121674 Transcript_56685/m.121674 type:complete len:227 (-) Transcript_56685:1262-1942(-)
MLFVGGVPALLGVGRGHEHEGSHPRADHEAPVPRPRGGEPTRRVECVPEGVAGLQVHPAAAVGVGPACGGARAYGGAAAPLLVQRCPAGAGDANDPGPPDPPDRHQRPGGPGRGRQPPDGSRGRGAPGGGAPAAGAGDGGAGWGGGGGPPGGSCRRTRDCPGGRCNAGILCSGTHRPSRPRLQVRNQSPRCLPHLCRPGRLYAGRPLRLAGVLRRPHGRVLRSPGG